MNMLALKNTSCCDPSCATCSGTANTDCTSCNQGFDHSNGMCTSNCPNHTYPKNGECLACASSCTQCINSSTECTECTAPLVLKNSACCDVSCATCSGTTNMDCLTCPDGTYLKNNQCLACSSPCATCMTDDVTCHSCLNNLSLVGSKCCHPTCA